MTFHTSSTAVGSALVWLIPLEKGCSRMISCNLMDHLRLEETSKMIKSNLPGWLKLTKVSFALRDTQWGSLM